MLIQERNGSSHICKLSCVLTEGSNFLQNWEPGKQWISLDFAKHIQSCARFWRWKIQSFPAQTPCMEHICVYTLTFFYFLIKEEQRCCWVFLKPTSDKSCSSVPWQPVLTGTFTSSSPPVHWAKRAIPFSLTDQCFWHTDEQWCLFLNPTVLLHFCVHEMQIKVLVPDLGTMKRQGA